MRTVIGRIEQMRKSLDKLETLYRLHVMDEESPYYDPKNDDMLGEAETIDWYAAQLYSEMEAL